MTDFSAVASALGYLYQPRYALLMLLRGNIKTELHIEKFDDLSLSEKGKIKNLSQLKHRKSGSLTDSSSDLWKTLRVWAETYKAGNIDLDTVQLTIITTANAPKNSIASLLMSEGRNPEEARTRLDKIAETSNSDTLEKAFQSYQKLSPEEKLDLLKQVVIYSNSSDIVDVKKDILNELKHVTRRKYLKPFLERLEGWWNEEILEHLYNDASEPIKYPTLEAKLDDLREQFLSENLPIDYRTFMPSAITQKDAKNRTFVKQLELICLSQPRIFSAIRDYYRAYHQVSRWRRESLLNLNEFEDYRERLREEWERHFDEMNETLGKTPDKESKISAGKKLYRWAEFEANDCIRTNCTEPYVSRGTYQMLAEEKDVGWHPDFLEELKEILVPKGGKK